MTGIYAAPPTVAATFADLLALAPDFGARATVSAPVVSGGATNTRWLYQSDGWRLDGTQMILADTVQVTGAAVATDQILKSYTFEPRVLRAIRHVRPQISATRSGTAEVLSLRGRFNSTLLLGTSVTTGSHKQAMLGASFWSPAVNKLAVEGDTVRPGGGSVFLDYVDVTVTLTGSVVFTVACQMSVGAEIPTVRYVFLWGS